MYRVFAVLDIGLHRSPNPVGSTMEKLLLGKVRLKKNAINKSSSFIIVCFIISLKLIEYKTERHF